VSKGTPAQLKRVRDSAVRLNELCDQASESVRVLEEFLNKDCSIGIEASVLVSKDEDPYHQSALSLRYGRWGNRFRVLLEWYETPCAEPGEETRSKPWVECKREDKLESLPFLCDLITAIDEAVQTRIQKAESAIAAISELTSTTRKQEVGNAKK
jgi:hypothetical protein